MAWNTTPSSRGSLIRASDIGVWLNDVTTQANTIVSRHCPSHYVSYRSSHYSSNRTHNSVGSGGSDNNRFNSSNGTFKSGGLSSGCARSAIKCGGEIIVRLNNIY